MPAETEFAVFQLSRDNTLGEALTQPSVPNHVPGSAEAPLKLNDDDEAGDYCRRESIQDLAARA